MFATLQLRKLVPFISVASNFCLNTLSSNIKYILFHHTASINIFSQTATNIFASSLSYILVMLVAELSGTLQMLNALYLKSGEKFKPVRQYFMNFRVQCVFKVITVTKYQKNFYKIVFLKLFIQEFYLPKV